MTAPDWGLLSLCDTSSAGATDPDHLGPDIVLVHGLGGERVTTWKAEDATIWARDLLPKRIPDIRVFTYGYPGTLKSLADLPTRRKIALELLQLLEAERKQFPTFARPIIWVGHGLGALIIKKAIMEARYDSAFMSIFHLTFGAVFFSTPHHGLDRELFSKMLMACKPPWVTLLKEPPSDFLDELDDRIECLERENEMFRGIRNIKFISLLEGSNSSSLNDVIVTHEQAILGGLPHDVEFVQHAHRDHHLMCEFPNDGLGGNRDSYSAVGISVRDSGTSFSSIAQLIEQAITTSRKLPGLDLKGIASLEWLGITKIRPARIYVEPTDGTCNWITQTAEYRLWNSPGVSSDGITNISKLWITGPAGCGKTHLAKHIWVNQDRELGSKNSHTNFTAHFSVDDILHGRRTFDSLLLCWTLDILMAQPWLIHRCLLPRYDISRAERPSSACDQSEAFLKDLWRDVIVNLAIDADCLVLIADGIDKCEHPELALRDLLDSVNEVAELSQDHGYSARFKLLMLSNHTPDLDVVARKESGLLVHSISEDSTNRDMQLTLKPHVDTILRRYHGGEDEALANVFWSKLVGSHNKNSYAWPAILVAELESFRQNIGSQDTLLRELTPGNLTELYREILGHRILGTTAHESSSPARVPAASTVIVAQNLLFWVTHQLGAMTKEELRIACDLSVKSGYPDGFHRDRPSSDLSIRYFQMEPQTPTNTINFDEIFEEALQGCTPLLRTASSLSSGEEQRFTAAHDSLREYIATIPPGTSHDIAAMICMNYLLLLPRNSPADPVRPPKAAGSTMGWQAEALDLISSYPFASYAATRWLDHFTLSLSSSSSKSSATPRKRRNLDLLLGPGSEFLRPWTLVLWYHTRGREGEPYPMDLKAGGGRGGFPWATVFSEKEVKVVENALRLASAAPSAVRSGGGDDAGDGRTGEGAGGPKRRSNSKIEPVFNPSDKGLNAIGPALRGRRGRVAILTVVIVLLVVVGAAVGGSQATKSR